MSSPNNNNQEHHNELHTRSGFHLQSAEQDESIAKVPSGVWSTETHQPVTAFEKQVERTLHLHFLFGSVLIALVSAVLVWLGINLTQRLTFVDTLMPDYSTLSKDSDDYWEQRTEIDISTARASDDGVVEAQRLKRFIGRSVKEAMFIDSDYNRVTAVAAIATTLAKRNVDFTMDEVMEKLGTSDLAMAVRCRVLVSQALMYLRLGKAPSANVAIKESNRLSIASDQRMNSLINEETFFGTVTVLKHLQANQELPAFFKQQLEFVLVLSIDAQSRAYRLIAGEQIRIGLISDAITTLGKIRNPVELARALELLLAYSARPPKVLMTEPQMLVLPTEHVDTPLVYPDRAKQIAKEAYYHLAKTMDADSQLDLLRRIAESRLLCDREMYSLFRESIVNSPEFSDAVKVPILQILDNPQSPAIRAALKLPVRADTPQMNVDTVDDDWDSSDELLPVAVIPVDVSGMVNRLDQQSVQTLITMAQSYLMFNRFSDAVRVLHKAYPAAQQFQKPEVRVNLLLRVAEQQIAAGMVSEARKTLQATLAVPEAVPEQIVNLARLQVIGRFFDDALKTLQTVSPAALRDGVYQFLAEEQIRIHRLDDAEVTLSKMSAGKAADSLRHLLNIAKEQGTDVDFNAVGILNPASQTDGAKLVQSCEQMLRSGLLHFANKTFNRITDRQSQDNLRNRIVREYMLLYDTYRHDTNIKQYVQQEVSAAAQNASRESQAAIWTTFLDRFTAQFQAETDRESGREQWNRALASYKSLDESSSMDAVARAECLAQLLLAKIAIEKPLGGTRRGGTYPLITRESNPLVFEELTPLIEECRHYIELTDSSARQGKPCVLLSKVLAQAGRTRAAHLLLEQTREIADELDDSDKRVELYLAMIPVYKSLNESAKLTEIYNAAVRTLVNAFTDKIQNVNMLAWRQRDASIDTVIRSEMEYGFIDNAVRSLNSINEPVLRDRLLRAAAYIYLDQHNIPVAESLTRRMTVKEMQRTTLQDVLLFKRRSEQREVTPL